MSSSIKNLNPFGCEKTASKSSVRGFINEL
jgi:hypothetical protein